MLEEKPKDLKQRIYKTSCTGNDVFTKMTWDDLPYEGGLDLDDKAKVEKNDIDGSAERYNH